VDEKTLKWVSYTCKYHGENLVCKSNRRWCNINRNYESCKTSRISAVLQSGKYNKEKDQHLSTGQTAKSHEFIKQ
jgi:hypothetical protein